MKFKASDRIQQVGKNKGKPIYIPDIKSDEDIPEKVKDFFKDSYNFLEELVGKDNIVYAKVHYDEDINNLIDYSKKIQKQNSNNKNVIKQKDVLIDELATKVGHLQSENNKLKDGRAIKERDTTIYEQQQTISKQKMVIKEKESIIKKLEDKVTEIQETFNNFKEKMFNFCDKICRALGHKIGLHFSKNMILIIMKWNIMQGK